MGVETALLGLMLGWLFGRQTYGEHGAKPAPPPPGPGPVPTKPKQVPWPNVDVVRADAPPPGGSPAQKKAWADVQAKQYERRKAQQMMLEDIERQRAQQQRAQSAQDHRVP